MLSAEGRKNIITETAKMKPGNMLMHYGITGNNRVTTIENARYARAEGAILAAPAYICADNDAITDYVLEVLDSTDLAMGFYNNPPRVKTDLHWTGCLSKPGKTADFNGRSVAYPEVRLVYWAGGKPFHQAQDLFKLDQAWKLPETVIVHEP